VCEGGKVLMLHVRFVQVDQLANDTCFCLFSVSNITFSLVLLRIIFFIVSLLLRFMASINSSRVPLLLIFYCWLILIVGSATINNKNNENNHHNPFYLRQKHQQATADSEFRSFDDSSTAMSNFEQRNVIWPRICYFARVTSSGVHQKLCLPYTDENRRRRHRRFSSTSQQTKQ
jgi:hypothetical protein